MFQVDDNGILTYKIDLDLTLKKAQLNSEQCQLTYQNNVTITVISPFKTGWWVLLKYETENQLGRHG